MHRVARSSRAPICVLAVLASAAFATRAAAQEAPHSSEPPAAAATPAPPPEPADDEPIYEAVAVAPSPGAATAARKVPRNVQILDRELLEREQALGVHALLSSRLGSATLSDVQSNPLQPDLQLRGFTASPLLGTPQGIAVYQNGVRMNDAFGDMVQWELLPMVAVSEVQVLPGASPIYGWNALGGSLVLRTKDGFRDAGHRFAGRAGSFGRYELEGEYGASFGAWAVYAALTAFGEQGYRDASQSQARTLHADVRHERDEEETSFTVSLADTDLRGNGPAPVELLAVSRRRVFTHPDVTASQHLLASASFTRELHERLSLQATAYLRHLGRGTLNADEADFETCAGAAGSDVLCDDDGEPLRSELDAEIDASTPGTRIFDAAENRTRTASDGYGGSVQLTTDAPWVGRPNQLVVGAAYDGAHVGYLQRAELGYLTPDRGVQGAETFLTGPGFRAALEVEHRALGMYASDTFDVHESVALTAAARVDWANVELIDRDGDALDGDHSFARVNPALGLTYRPIDALTMFVGYGESTRTPSAAELSCADPDAPCRVPNAFVADPPLDQVVARSVELGARGELGGSRKRRLLEWSIAGFGSRSDDDILFIAGSRVGTGYFRNAGRTQRLGLELSLSGEVSVLRWYAAYTLLRATFETALLLPGTAHPGATASGPDGARVIAVEPGDRMPGLPTHTGKAGLDVEPLSSVVLGANALAQSSQPFRGDEANLLDQLAGFVVLGAHASYRPWPQLTLSVRVENLLDTEYETFGVIADPSEVLEGTSDPRFVSPARPLSAWAGVTLQGP